MAERYIEAVGRRKTATTRVRITPSKKLSVVVNGKDFDDYFKTDIQKKIALAPIELLGLKNYSISIKVKGSSLVSQAKAIQLGLARALEKEDSSRRKELKESGYLKRDPRKKERKKFGLKKARRAPQWSKR